MSALLSKSLRNSPIEIVDGDGIWLIARDGTRYLDSCGGVAVSALGHKHPQIVAASEAAARDISWVHAGTFTTSAVGALADYLAASSGNLDKVYFMSGGSEIMEIALKLALQHHAERGEPSRTTFISRRQSYHGSTLGTLALSGNLNRRACFEPILTTPVEFVDPCYEYRYRRADQTTEQYVSQLARQIDDTIIGVGPHKVAAFVAETVVGSTSGAVPAVPGYLDAVQKVCRRHGVLLILDEVMCGLGRTGRYFAFHDDGVKPDMVAVGKGLGAGYAPLSALLVTDEVLSPIQSGSGTFENGQTHVNNPHAAAVSLAVQRIVQEEGVLQESLATARVLKEQLAQLNHDLPVIGDVRGRGMFLGLEFVDPDNPHSPIPDGSRFSSALKTAGLENGLLLYPGHGTVDGLQGAHLLLAPPLIATSSEIGHMVDKIHTSIKEATYDWQNNPVDSRDTNRLLR